MAMMKSDKTEEMFEVLSTLDEKGRLDFAAILDAAIAREMDDRAKDDLKLARLYFCADGFREAHAEHVAAKLGVR